MTLDSLYKLNLRDFIKNVYVVRCHVKKKKKTPADFLTLKYHYWPQKLKSGFILVATSEVF